MSLSTPARGAYSGVAGAILGSVAFSGKPIIVNLAYRHGVAVLTLLALRMTFAPAFFRRQWAGAVHLTRRDGLGVDCNA